MSAIALVAAVVYLAAAWVVMVYLPSRPLRDGEISLNPRETERARAEQQSRAATYGAERAAWLQTPDGQRHLARRSAQEQEARACAERWEAQAAWLEQNRQRWLARRAAIIMGIDQEAQP